MAKLSKTARASGATGKTKSKGPKRSKPNAKKGHRAHKRDSVALQPVGEGRDKRKAAKREARAELIAGLVKDAEERLDEIQVEANDAKFVRDQALREEAMALVRNEAGDEAWLPVSCLEKIEDATPVEGGE